LKLASLAIRRLPGIHTPFGLGADQLSAGVHVVHGPNGSGKSSLCRALSALLWPQRLEGFGVDVEARFEHGGSTWIARREGRDVRWQRDGAPSAPPELPDARHWDCYVIGLDDLDGEQDGAWFAQRVWQAMAGGYDVRKLRAELFTPGQRHGVRQEDAWREAREALRKAELEQEDILREEGELAGLERELEATRKAQRAIDTLSAAHELAKTRVRLTALARELEAFPPGMAAVRGDEGERLESLDAERTALEKTREQLLAGLEEQRRRLERARLEAPLAHGVFTEQRQRLADLRVKEAELARIHSDVASARGRRDEAGAAPGAGPAPSAALLESLDDLARRNERLSAERAALEIRLSTLAELPDGADGETLDRGARLLREWLAAGVPPSDGRGLWVLAASTVALAIVLGTRVHPVYFTGCLVALLAVAGALIAKRRDARKRVGRPVLQLEFERTRLAPPAAWESQAVERRLHEISGETAALRFAEQEAGSRREVEAHLQALSEREQDLAARRLELRRQLGAAEGLSDLGLVDLAARLRNSRNAEDELIGAQAKRATLQAARDSVAAELAKWLVEHGEKSGGDAPALEGALEALHARSSTASEAKLDAAHIERQLAENADQLARLNAQRERIFAIRGLEPHDQAGLIERLESRERWERIHLDHVKQVQRESELLDQLQSAPEWTELDADELEQRLEAARSRAEGRDSLVERLTAIRTRAEGAGRRSTLEDARAAEQSAREALTEELDTALSAAAGQLLVDEVEREHSIASRPAVLERARGLFAAFTAQRYTMDVSEVEGGVHLRAQAAIEPERDLAADELSGGTRAQLLLAARLAFAAEHERDARLPVFLDDVLATSDPQRVGAIAQSLFALAASEGRQVFVLTPDASDVELLRAAGGPLSVVDLGALRGQQDAVVERERLMLPERRELPDCEGRAPDDYARELGVPGLDPWRSAADTHLYYLLADDLPLLRKLLTWRIERLGPLRTTVAAGGVGFLGADELERIEVWARVFESVRRSWRVGRGLPIDRGALEAAGLPSNYLDRLTDLSEVGCDAKRLLAKLEARDDKRFKGIHGTTLERLRANLETSGHLDPQDPLDVEAAWRRLLGDLDELPAGSQPAPEQLRQRFDFLRARFDEAAGR
jgi:DNA repair protein SbcC/Rad50